jgi:hypothetical protein
MFTLVDRYGQRTQFVGIHLARTSSWREGSVRWSEIDLYRTSAGAYIIHQTGQSSLYHVEGCPVIRRNAKTGLAAMLSERDVACPCVPQDLDPNVRVFSEVPLSTVTVVSRADDVVKFLTKTDDKGVSYLTTLARSLLSEAATMDEDIHDATAVRFVD